MMEKMTWRRRLLFGIGFMMFAAVIGFGAYLSFLSSANEAPCRANDQVRGENPSGITEQLQAVLKQYSRTHNNVGLQATVIWLDGRQWSGTSGFASDASACPLTLDHDLYIGSITKTITAALVMEQVEAGLIRLDQTINPWISHPASDRITIEMLLHHTSGLPSYTDNLSLLLAFFGLPRKQWQPDDLLAYALDKPLKFAPGSRYEYSNTNFLVLGMILEKVSNRSYGELLQQTANRLGLQRIYYPGYSQSSTLANGYDETMFNLGKRNLSAFRTALVTGAFSAGGVAASSQDLAVFFNKLFNHEIFGTEFLSQMMQTVDAPDEDVPLQVGYGLGNRHLVMNGEKLYGHTGTIPGYSGIAMHNPQRGLTIVVLSNVSTIDQISIFSDLQKVVLSANE